MYFYTTYGNKIVLPVYTIIFVLNLNIKIAGSNISFNTLHLSRKYLKMRIINKEYRKYKNTTPRMHQK